MLIQDMYIFPRYNYGKPHFSHLCLRCPPILYTYYYKFEKLSVCSHSNGLTCYIHMV